MMVAMDYVWFGVDDWQVEQSNRLLRFFHKQGIDRITPSSATMAHPWRHSIARLA